MKSMLDMRVSAIERLSDLYALISLSPCKGALPCDIKPGQFVQIQIPNSPSTYLRRPISICDIVDGTLKLLVRNAGEGTKHLINAKVDDVFSVIIPLGNGFSMPLPGHKIMLIGGGVGVAPLLYFGKELRRQGYEVAFALGARKASDLLLIEQFKAVAEVHVTTEDGSVGEKGFVTQHTAMDSVFDCIACCGPTPMMKAVANLARKKGIPCEVSLENMMACGLGACLCCVENTTDGNVCVCTEGPVFNIEKLLW